MIFYVVELPAGGQDLGGPHRVGWVGSTAHYQDNAGEHVSRLVGSDLAHDCQIMWGKCL